MGSLDFLALAGVGASIGRRKTTKGCKGVKDGKKYQQQVESNPKGIVGINGAHGEYKMWETSSFCFKQTNDNSTKYQLAEYKGCRI